MKNIFLLFLLAAFFTACNGTGSQVEGEDTADTTGVVEDTPPAQYTLTPFTESVQYSDAEIESMDFKDGTFQFIIGGEEYKLGEQTPDAGQKMCANSAKGQHIHLIVDNNPYAAKYTATFDYEIEDGQHYILAFLSRSYHESIKTDKAHDIFLSTIENNTIKDRALVDGPMLFYSRPKGTYVGEKDTKKVMLDFYLINAQLGDQYKVKAEINGEVHMLDKWQPYYIEGLPMGENTIKLTLVDAEGNKVEAPLNPVQRKFTLAADPAENM